MNGMMNSKSAENVLRVSKRHVAPACVNNVLKIHILLLNLLYVPHVVQMSIHLLDLGLPLPVTANQGLVPWMERSVLFVAMELLLLVDKNQPPTVQVHNAQYVRNVRRTKIQHKVVPSGAAASVCRDTATQTIMQTMVLLVVRVQMAFTPQVETTLHVSTVDLGQSQTPHRLRLLSVVVSVMQQGDCVHVSNHAH